MWRVPVGEIEHEGDIELTILQLAQAGATHIELLEVSFDDEHGLFRFEHEARDIDTLRAALDEAGVCW